MHSSSFSSAAFAELSHVSDANETKLRGGSRENRATGDQTATALLSAKDSHF